MQVGASRLTRLPKLWGSQGESVRTYLKRGYAKAKEASKVVDINAVKKKKVRRALVIGDNHSENSQVASFG